MEDAVAEGHDEGWYKDPYGIHDARWLSDGVPTKLVRDGDTESYADPPDTPPTQTPVRLEAPVEPLGGADLKRSGQYERRALYLTDAVFMLSDRAREIPS